MANFYEFAECCALELCFDIESKDNNRYGDGPEFEDEYDTTDEVITKIINRIKAQRGEVQGHQRAGMLATLNTHQIEFWEPKLFELGFVQLGPRLCNPNGFNEVRLYGLFHSQNVMALGNN